MSMPTVGDRPVRFICSGGARLIVAGFTHDSVEQSELGGVFPRIETRTRSNDIYPALFAPFWHTPRNPQYLAKQRINR